MADENVTLSFTLRMQASQVEDAVNRLRSQFGAQVTEMGRAAEAGTSVASRASDRLNTSQTRVASTATRVTSALRAQEGEMSRFGRMGQIVTAALDRQLQIVSFRSGILVAGSIALGRTLVRLGSEASRAGSGMVSAATGASLLSIASDKIARAEHTGRVRMMTDIYGAFVRRLKEAEGGAGGASRAFQKLGIDLTDALKNPLPHFQSFMLRVAGTQSASERAHLAYRGLGQGAVDLMPAINALAGSLGQTTVAARGLGSGLLVLGGVLGVSVVAVLALMAAYGGLMYLMFKSADLATKWGDEVYKASVKANLSAETMSTLRVGAESANVSFDSVGRAMGRLQNNMVRAATDTKSEVARAFRAIGFEGDRLREAVKNPDKGVRDFIDTFNKMKPSAERAALAVRVIGEDVHTIIPILNQARGGFDKLEEKARAMGLMFSGRAARDAHVFQQSLREVRLVGSGLAVQFGSVIAPVIVGALRSIGSMMQGLRPVIQALAQAAARHITQTIEQIKLLLIAGKAVWEGVKAITIVVVECILQFRNLAAIATKALGAIATAASGPQGIVPAAKILAGLATDVDNVLKTIDSRMEQSFKKARDNTSRFIGGLYKPYVPPEEAPQEVEAEFPVKEDRSAERELAAAQRRRLRELELNLREAERVYARETEAAAREYDQRLIDLEKFAAKRRKTEDDLLKARQAVFEAEREVVNASVFKESERSLKLAEIADKEREATHEHAQAIIRIDQETVRKRFEIAQAAARQRDELAESSEQTQIERIRKNAEEGLITYTQAHDSIETITQQSYRRRTNALRDLLKQEGISRDDYEQITREIEKLDAEAAESKVSSSRKRIEAMRKDAEEARKWSDAMRQIADEIIDIELDLAERRLSDMPELYANSRERITAQFDLAERQEIERSRRASDRIRRDTAEQIRLAGENAEKQAEAQAAGKRRMEAEERRHDAEMTRIRRRRARAQEADLPTSRRATFGDAIADAMEGAVGRMQQLGAAAYEVFAGLSAAAGNMGSMITNAFSSMAQAAGQLLQQWILTGETGPAALRKMTAQILASLAAEAAVKALMELAAGFAALATPWTAWRAPFHFKAAAIYGAVAGVAALAGRAIAGDLFKTDKSATGGEGERRTSQGGSAKQARTIYDTSRPRVVEKIVTVRLEPGLIGKEMTRDYYGNGQTRKLMNRKG